MSRSIALIGYRGTGKTSVGKLLAENLGFLFVDTDQLLEKRYRETIAAIFSRGGENLFRQYETEVLKSLETIKEPLVIATGGGLPLREENRQLLSSLASGHLFLLTAPPHIIAERLLKDTRTSETRPPLTQLPFQEEISATLKKRTPIYESLADYVVSTEGKDIAQTADEILTRYAV